jgi:transcriptional regulator with XRE-family HTH domain
MRRTLQQRVGARIRQRREALGLTQVDLARKARLGRVTINRIERGVQGLTLSTLQPIARALRVRFRDLLP